MSTSFIDTVQEVTEKCAVFDEKLGKVKRMNSDLRVRAEKLLTEIKILVGTAVTSKKLCQVCYTQERTVVFGCGHLFCLPCSERAHRRDPPRCFTCRAPLECSFKIYL